MKMNISIDKAIKIMMAVSTVISGVCSILIQLQEDPVSKLEKINDCNGELSSKKKK